MYHSFDTVTIPLVDNCMKKWPNKWKRIAFGCKSLDELTMNGVPTQGIIEICGEAGSGKTQLCLQLSLTVQLPEQYGGLSRGTLFKELFLFCYYNW